MNLAHNRHTEWLTQQLQEANTKLLDAQNAITETKQTIAYLKKMTQIVNNGVDSEPQNSNNTKFEANNSVEGNDSKRTPKQMLIPEYAELSLGDAIHSHLLKLGTETSLDEMVHGMFNAETEDEYQRSKASLSTELRRGQINGRWEKAGRGCWVLSVNLDNSEPKNEETQNGVVEKKELAIAGGNNGYPV